MNATSPAPIAAPESELSALLRLSLPLVAAQAGNNLMSFVDTAMVGRLGKTSIAAVSISNGLYFTLTVFGLGCVLGGDAPIAQAVGAGEEALARRLLFQTLRVAAWTALPVMLLVGAIALRLESLGVDAQVAAEARRYLIARTPNALPFLLFIALRSYLQAHGATRAIVAAMVVANLFNFAGNALFVYGDATLQRLGLPPLGLPALGITGSGLASTLASLLSVAILAAAVGAVPTPPDPNRRTVDPPLVRKIFFLGAPIGLQMLAEVGVFALAGFLAERLGAAAVAGHQVALTLASFTFCVALGVGSATSVRVGFHVGRGDTAAARRAGVTGLVAAALFMSLSSLAFFLVPSLLARLLTNDPGVIAAAAPLIMVAAVFQLSDGTQAVGAGALRGAGDARVPLYANLAGHYLIGLPIAIGLGFSLHLGVVGLWWGLSAGLTAVAALLVWRFFRITSRPIDRA